MHIILSTLRKICIIFTFTVELTSSTLGSSSGFLFANTKSFYVWDLWPVLSAKNETSADATRILLLLKNYANFKLRKKKKVNKKCFVILQPLNFIVIFWRAFLMSCFFGNVSFNVFSRRFHRQAVNHALAGCNMGFLSRLMQAYMYCYRKKSSLQPINWTSDTLDRLKSAHSHPLASKIIFFKDEQKIQTIF